MKKSHVIRLITALGLASITTLVTKPASVGAEIIPDAVGLCTVDKGQESSTFPCLYDHSIGTGVTFLSFYEDTGNGRVSESNLIGTFVTQMSIEPHVLIFVWPDGSQEEIRGLRNYDDPSSFTFWIERGWAINFRPLATDSLE
jgi:hypothetical protein